MTLTHKITHGKQRLTKPELRQIWYRWGFTHLSSMSYEKLQAHAWAFSYLPFADKYYQNDPEGKQQLLLRHSMFYNTEPQTGQLINGIVASMEEEIALGGDVPASLPINIKATLMGPLAGIGDSLIQGIIVPVLLSIAMSMAADGSIIGPLFYLLSYAIIGPLISYLSFFNGYKLGVNAIDKIIGDDIKQITDAINVLGIIVVGALAAGNIVLTSSLQIPMGDSPRALQDILDSIFPNILPLLTVLLSWWLLTSKQMSPTKVILTLTSLITIGALIGLF